eukprot:6033071-Prymnesium_polylepis.2
MGRLHTSCPAMCENLSVQLTPLLMMRSSGHEANTPSTSVHREPGAPGGAGELGGAGGGWHPAGIAPHVVGHTSLSGTLSGGSATGGENVHPFLTASST